MKKYLGRLDLFAIVLGAIIGWGSFMLPGTKFLKEGGVIGTAAGLILGTLCIIIIERNYEVMMGVQTEEGGEFSFAYNNLGKGHGFWVGWFLTLAYFTMIPLNATAFPLVIKKLAGKVLEFGYLYHVAGYDVYLGEILVSTVTIILFAYLNIRGVKDTGSVQKLIVFALIFSIVLVFAGMLVKADKAAFAANYITGYKFDIGGVAKVFAITPFAFVGFDTVPQLCKEYKFSSKKASVIAVISLLAGVLIYNTLNVITALAFSPDEASALDWAAGSAVLKMLGKGFFVLLIIALSAAVWSGINGFMLCSSKLLGAIANYGMLPKGMGEQNRNGAFQNAILFVSAVSLIAPWFGREAVIWIVDMSSVGAAVAYGYVSKIAYKKCGTRAGRVLSVLGVLVSILFVLLQLLPMSPAFLGKESLIALLIWCLLGGFFYVRLK